MEHILHIFVFFDALDEFLNLGTLFLGEFLGVIGNAFKLGAGNLETVVFEIFLYGVERLKLTIDYDFLFIGIYFIDTEIDQFEFKVFEGNAIFGFDVENALMVERNERLPDVPSEPPNLLK